MVSRDLSVNICARWQVERNRLRYLQAAPSRKALYKHETRRPAEVGSLLDWSEGFCLISLLCDLHATMYFANSIHHCILFISEKATIDARNNEIDGSVLISLCSSKQVLLMRSSTKVSDQRQT